MNTLTINQAPAHQAATENAFASHLDAAESVGDTWPKTIDLPGSEKMVLHKLFDARGKPYYEATVTSKEDGTTYLDYKPFGYHSEYSQIDGQIFGWNITDRNENDELFTIYKTYNLTDKTFTWGDMYYDGREDQEPLYGEIIDMDEALKEYDIYLDAIMRNM